MTLRLFIHARRPSLKCAPVLVTALSLVIATSGCGTTKAEATLSAIRSSAGSIDFGTGLDKSTGTITGPTNTFTVGNRISFVAHLSRQPGADVRITIVQDEGTVEQVVGSEDVATPSPNDDTLFDTLNTAAAALGAGTFTLKIFHADTQIASGTFRLTAQPSAPAYAGSTLNAGDSSSIVVAVNNYEQALHDVYGPGYSVSMLGEVATGRAAQAIWCTVQAKPNSLVNTHSYYTYSDVSDQFQPVQFSGNSATAPVHIQEHISTHHADGTVTGYDADYTITFTLIDTGYAWKVTDYSWIGSDNSQGSATQDARPCA